MEYLAYDIGYLSKNLFWNMINLSESMWNSMWWKKNAYDVISKSVASETPHLTIIFISEAMQYRTFDLRSGSQ